MQKEDLSILKQVVLFALLALILGFAYGQSLSLLLVYMRKVGAVLAASAFFICKRYYIVLCLKKIKEGLLNAS